MGKAVASVGIEKISVYPATLALDMAALCAARQHDPSDVSNNLMVDRRSLNPSWEDAVTMAVNAASPLLTDEDKARIGLVIVGSETSVDQEKPLSSWVHHFLGIQPHCRNFELKHACYSGTAGLQMAASWLASGLAGDKKALVINTDQSLIGFNQPWEFVFGAAAVALLVSRQPDFLELELGKSGVYAHHVTDVIRPTGRVETGNSDASLYAYLEALDGAYGDYRRQTGPFEFSAYFKKNVYHTPFGGMAFRAHRALLQHHLPELSKREARADFEKKVAASLHYTRQIGGSYGASTFIALLGLIETSSDLLEGDRIGIFSYGSGSCAEFYSARVGAKAREVARSAGLQALLDRRQGLAVEEYEAIERERDAGIGAVDFRPDRGLPRDWYERFYAGKRLLVLEQVETYVRQYVWS